MSETDNPAHPLEQGTEGLEDSSPSIATPAPAMLGADSRTSASAAAYSPTAPTSARVGPTLPMNVVPTAQIHHLTQTIENIAQQQLAQQANLNSLLGQWATRFTDMQTRLMNMDTRFTTLHNHIHTTNEITTHQYDGVVAAIGYFQTTIKENRIAIKIAQYEQSELTVALRIWIWFTHGDWKRRSEIARNTVATILCSMMIVWFWIKRLSPELGFAV